LIPFLAGSAGLVWASEVGRVVVTAGVVGGMLTLIIPRTGRKIVRWAVALLTVNAGFLVGVVHCLSGRAIHSFGERNRG
jgi:hypothetical protein